MGQNAWKYSKLTTTILNYPKHISKVNLDHIWNNGTINTM